MVKIGVVIKTKDRSPRRNYLGDTYKNLERAGVLASSHLAFLKIMDSGSSVQFFKDNLPLQFDARNVFSHPRTLHQNAARCIQLASEGFHTYAMVIEDDLDFSDGFLESVVAWLQDHPGSLMYALGANYAQIQGVAERGQSAWNYPVGAFYGAQALVWRREDAAQLAQWLGPDPNYNGVKDHGHDLLLQRWARERGFEFFLAAAPCMVQHIGNESGIGNRFFQFPWGGREWRYERRVA